MRPASPESHVAGYRPDIDGLRAVAILMVVLFHAFPARVPGGFVGVDVFFVISGFLISMIILKALDAGSFTFRDFYARRTRRIFPALVVVLPLTAAAGWVALLPTEYTQLGKHLAAGALFLQNVALYREAGYFDVASELKPLMHLWSLAVEEQFYLGYPLLLWLAARLRLSTVAVIALVAAASFGVSVWRLDEHPVEVFFLPHARLWELLLGGLLAHATRSGALERWVPAGSLRAHLASVLGLTLALAAGVLLSREVSFPGASALGPTFGAALLIAAGPSALVNRAVLAARPMVFVGLISYPLYLWHWPLLSFNAMVSRDSSASTRGALVLAAVGLAWATRRLVEWPFRFSPAGGRWRVPALLGAMAASAALGGAIVLGDGVPRRFPAEIGELASFSPDFKTDARSPACWLSSTNPASAFSAECVGAPAGGPGSVFLWGDSHAARLYPGLVKALGVRPSQYTRDACAPSLGFATYPICNQSNEWVLEQVKRLAPETVVLFGAWHKAARPWEASTPAGQGLQRTLRALKAAGVARTVVLGNSPKWAKELPRLVYDAWKDDYPLHRLPRRLRDDVMDGLPERDGELRALVEAEGASFISMLELLCDSSGCMTYASDDPASLMSWDDGHLTTPGAEWVAARLAPRVRP
jgi:peptidoglycan/LPS O-acetylase OafA/YrhL